MCIRDSLIGKTCILPIMNREIPIFGDEYVDKEFGTGCVKVTPCHDPNDFEMGQRHNLEQILVFLSLIHILCWWPWALRLS